MCIFLSGVAVFGQIDDRQVERFASVENSVVFNVVKTADQELSLIHI